MPARTANPGSQRATKIARFCALAAMGFSLPGCPPPYGPNSNPAAQTRPGDESPGAREDGGERSKIAAGQGFLFEIVLKTTVVEAPAGTISSSEDIWSYVDEEPVSGRASGLLGRNGIRAGVGPSENWPRVAAVLNRLAGKPLRHSISTVFPGDRTSLPAVVYDQPQTIFMFRGDLTLMGADYPAGEYSFNLAAWLDQDDPGRLILAFCPKAVSAKRESQFVPGPHGMEMITRPAEHILDQTAFNLAMRSGEFLVIGPGWQAARSDSIGGVFFTRKTNDIRMETVYIIVPEIKARPIQRGG